MNTPEIDVPALLELAESRFRAWLLTELVPERKRQFDGLRTRNLSSSGRATQALRISSELLQREVRQRIHCYAETARQRTAPELYTEIHLNELRQKIMASVAATLDALKDMVERDAHAAGDVPPSAFPPQARYTQVRSEILDVVNAELRVLAAEGKLVPTDPSIAEPSEAIAEDQGIAKPSSTATGRHPKVFISYSRDRVPRDHCDRVHALADRLVRDGVDAMIDRYQPSPKEGWPGWMLAQIRDSDFVLCICTATYKERFENQSPEEEGRGARFEGHVITAEIYRAACQSEKFVPVLLEEATEADIPTILAPYTYHRLPEQYDLLYARLTRQAPYERPPLGEVREIRPQRPATDDQTEYRTRTS